MIASSVEKDNLSSNENNLLAEDPNSFTALYNNIYQDQVDELILLTDYSFNSEYDADFKNGIPINRNITIDGNGHTIDAMNQSRIFNVILNNINVIFKNTVFIKGNHDNGGAITGKSTSINCTFINNTATDYGGAIYGGSAEYCSFYDNEANEGGAIYIAGNNFWIDSCTFVNNYANESGGAIYLDTGISARIENCTFKRNKAKTGGALSIVYSQNVGVLNSTFADNVAELNGGAINFDFSIYNKIDNCLFENNSATGNGGAFVWIFSNGNITNIDFKNNTATGNGGAIFIQISESASLINNQQLMNCSFTDNRAKNGGAIYNNDYYRIFASTDSTLNFINNTAEENGGAVYCVDSCNFSYSTFLGNSATERGGAIYCNDDCAMYGSEFFNNTAISGSAIYFDGKENYIKDTTFLFNKANSTVFANNEYLTLTFTLSSEDNFLNAIHSYFSFDCSNVTYYNGTITNTDEVPPVYGDYASANFTMEIYDSSNNLVANLTKETNDKGQVIFDYSNLDIGNYLFIVYLEGNGYYTEYFTNISSKVGEFAKLDRIVHFAGENSIVTLTQNYTFSIGLDDVSEIYIQQMGLSINGNGYTINALNQSNIFYAFNGGRINIFNCSFVNGQNLFRDMDYVSISNCNFINNSANFGGAVEFMGLGNVTIEYCNFTNNHADYGGALFLEGSDLTVSNCIFRDNLAANEGGAISARVLNFHILNSSFFNNSANDGGALYSYQYDENIVDYCIFTNNSAKSGGAIYWGGTRNIIRNSELLSNKAESSSLNLLGEIGDEIVIVFEGKNNYINAIYAPFGFEMENVSYWNGEIVNSDDQIIYPYSYPGQNISLEIYDSLDNLVENLTLVTDDESRISYNIIHLNDGNYRFNTYHLDDNYYSYISGCNGTFNLNRHPSSVIINIEDNAEFIYSDCNISFSIVNKTAPVIIITSYDGSKVYINQTIDDDFIIIALPPAEDYYNITVVNPVNSMFQGSQDSKLFKLLKANSSINVHPIDDVVFGNEFDVTFDVENLTCLNVTVFDERGNVVFNVSTESTVVSIPALVVGQYNLTVINVEGENFTESSDSVLFNVVKANSSVVIRPIADVVYGSDAFVELDVENLTSLNVTVLDAEGNIVFNVITESTVVSIPSLAAGSYNITVINMGNENFTESIDSILFNVVKASSSVVVHPIDDVMFGNGFDVEFDVVNRTVVNVTVFDASGNIVFSEIAVDNHISIPVLAGGRYNLTVANLEGENFTESSDSVFFNVFKASSSVVVHSIDDVVYGNGFDVSFDVENLTCLNVTVFDESGNAVFNVISGSTVVSIPVLAAGRYNITVINVENENITESSDSEIFNIIKASSSVVVRSVEDVVYGNEAFAEFEAENWFALNVTVFDEEGNAVFNAVIGEESLYIPVLAAGRYNLTVVNVESENFTESSDSVFFNVFKASSSVVVHPIDDVVYGNEFEVTFDVVNRTVVNVTVFDASGNIVFSEIAVDDLASIPVLAAGRYNLTVANIEGMNFTESSDSVIFNVLKANSSVVILPVEDVVYGNEAFVEFDAENWFALNVTVFDASGNAVFNEITESTVVSIPVLAAGRYNLTVVNVESENFTESSDSAVFNVLKTSSSISLNPIFDIGYGNEFTVKFDVRNLTSVNLTIFDERGNVVFNEITESTVVTIPVLAAGRYNITVINVENENITESSDSEIFNIIKASSSVVVRSVEDVVYGNEAFAEFEAENWFALNVTVFDEEGNAVFNAVIGEESLYIPVLAAGRYNLTVVNVESENFTESSDSVFFNVFKASSSVVVHPIDDVVYGNEFEVTFDVVNRTVVNVTVFDASGNIVFSEIAVDDLASIPVLAAGRYNLTVANIEGMNFTESSDSVIFNVLKANSSVVILPVEDVVYGNEAFVEFDAENWFALNVTVFDASGNAVFNEITESTVVSIPVLAAGRYNLTVVNVESENFTESIDSILFNVVKASSSVVVHPIDDVMFGNGFDVEFDVVNRTVVNVTVFDASGNIVFSEIAVDNHISIPVLAGGRYNLTVANLEGENFTESSDSVFFNVVKASSSVVVHPIDDVMFGNGFDVSFDVENLTCLNVTVFDESGNAVFNVISGSTVVSIPALAAGRYNLTVINIENENFTESSDSAVFNVFKVNSTININLVENQIYGYGIDVEFTGENLTTINVRVYDEKGNEVFSQNTTERLITIPILPVGSYIINATNCATESVGESNASRTFHISPANSNLTITLSPENIVYGESITATFALYDSAGNPVNGIIEVLCDDIRENITVEDGKATKTFEKLVAGTYTIAAVFAGDNNLIGSQASKDFYVGRLGTQIIFQDMNTKAVSPADGKVGEWFKFTLKDSNGKALPNTPMQIGFNGVIYDEKNGIVTDENGTSKLQINLGYKGVYTFAICYLGDENYNASFVVAKITVDCQTPKLIVPNKSYKATAKTKALTATFKTVKGTPVANKKVSFTVNGTTYSAKTNDKGIATVNVSISKKGSYAVTAKFAGDSTYAAIKKTATLKVS